jgi:hypothetical protein
MQLHQMQKGQAESRSELEKERGTQEKDKKID